MEGFTPQSRKPPTRAPTTNIILIWSQSGWLGVKLVLGAQVGGLRDWGWNPFNDPSARVTKKPAEGRYQKSLPTLQ